ncbi:MAG: Gfo/Idh/MocA family protein [Pirellulales bacterium]
MKPRINRRTFVKSSAALSAMAGFNILPASAQSPNEKLNIAFIGCANQGFSDARAALSNPNVNVVALCDVVPDRANNIKSLALKKQPNASIPVFDDFRKMFDRMGDKIEACTIGVPDHAHFPIAMLAMSLGKHIYVEKPLAHTFEECELLMAAEKKYKVACQMGNQGHSADQRRQFEQWVDRGLLTNVRRVDACMNKGRRWHPWGKVTSFPEAQKMPAGMNWDAWTGTAPMHSYNSRFDPGNWRGWYDYGDGAFGDWGPHTLDSVHRFLKLGMPHEIRADKLEGQNDFVYPMASTIAFEFAERGPGMPAMSINWYDGTMNRPPKPAELGKSNMPACGKIIYTDDLVIKGGTHSSGHNIIGGEGDRSGDPEAHRRSENFQKSHEQLHQCSHGQGRMQFKVLRIGSAFTSFRPRLHRAASGRHPPVRSQDAADHQQRTRQRVAQRPTTTQGLGTVLQAVEACVAPAIARATPNFLL